MGPVTGLDLQLAWVNLWRTRYHKLPPASAVQDWTHDHLQVAGWLFLLCSTFCFVRDRKRGRLLRDQIE